MRVVGGCCGSGSVGSALVSPAGVGHGRCSSLREERCRGRAGAAPLTLVDVSAPWTSAWLYTESSSEARATLAMNLGSVLMYVGVDKSRKTMSVVGLVHGQSHMPWEEEMTTEWRQGFTTAGIW